MKLTISFYFIKIKFLILEPAFYSKILSNLF
ncbi:Hypothetical protein KK9_0150 [Borreliella garinii BgVir]|nr:Hypothetical protein KK9_0150 [Borreliella garinii BgVir]